MGGPPGLRWLSVSSCLLLAVVAVRAQENAEMTIPASLLPCYTNATLLSRAGLPSFGIGQLIDLIRKVEDWPYTRLDLRQMAVQLTQRFRLDGVKRNPMTLPSEGVIPFTPAGPEFFRHKILLTKLIPGSAYNFPNDSLSIAEQCALHFMLSTTVDDIARPSEGTECSNLRNYETDVYGTSSSGGYSGGYRGGYSGGGYSGGGYGGGYSSGVNYNSRRQPPTRGPRRTRDAQPGIESDVEIIDPTLRAEVTKTKASMSNYVHSACPLQGGVVFTPWGGVSAGTVVAGIAAGIQPQSVPAELLAAAFPRSRHYTARRNPGLASDTMGTIDNKWAATFSGDLAQVALLQGAAVRDRMQVGLAGGWNSTVEPKHYFLSQLSEGAMSDANIRGCIDGLVMGSYVYDWNSRSGSSLKLSQLLDMYYSERGVFDRSTRACRRREVFGDVASTQTLDSQTETFSRFYADKNPITVTMTDDVIRELSDIAVTKLQSYIPSSLNDPACTAGTTDLVVRPYVNLIVVLDMAWQYMYIHPAISFLLDKIDAGRQGSKVMILNGKDGSILFNSTYPRLDWHTNYTQDVHERAAASGQGANFDMLVALGASVQRLRDHDYDFYQRRVLGGRGQAVLFVPTQGMGSVNQNTLWERTTNFRQLYPDVDMLVLTQGNKNAFSAITNDTNQDVFVLNPTDPANSILPLVERLKKVPRRIRNPNCNPDWSQTSSGNNEFVDYVEPMGVNYYRIAPNNFFRTNVDNAKIRVQSSYGTVTVCWSRSPVAVNGTRNTQASDQQKCSQVSNNGVEYFIKDLCTDASYVKDCKPIYLAVSSTTTQQGSQSVRCTDDACRYPDMIKFSVIAERMGCWSGASSLHGAVVLVTLLLSLILLQ